MSFLRQLHGFEFYTFLHFSCLLAPSSLPPPSHDLELPNDLRLLSVHPSQARPSPRRIGIQANRDLGESGLGESGTRPKTARRIRNGRIRTRRIRIRANLFLLKHNKKLPHPWGEYGREWLREGEGGRRGRRRLQNHATVSKNSIYPNFLFQNCATVSKNSKKPNIFKPSREEGAGAMAGSSDSLKIFFF